VAVVPYISFFFFATTWGVFATRLDCEYFPSRCARNYTDSPFFPARRNFFDYFSLFWLGRLSSPFTNDRPPHQHSGPRPTFPLVPVPSFFPFGKFFFNETAFPSAPELPSFFFPPLFGKETGVGLMAYRGHSPPLLSIGPSLFLFPLKILFAILFFPNIPNWGPPHPLRLSRRLLFFLFILEAG